MAPPPLPFFRGAQISAAEETDLLVVRPRGGLLRAVQVELV